MTRRLFTLLAVVLSLALVAGCATGIKQIPAQDLNPKVKSGALVQKTNNFEVIMDTSASMDEPYKWNHLAYHQPAADHGAGVRAAPGAALQRHDSEPEAHGGSARFCRRADVGRNFDTKLWYGMSPWAKADLDKAIFAVNTAGVESPLDKALDAATMDLKPLAGKSAVIIFSDGLEMPKAVASAQAMKAAMKDNICIYVVQVGPDKITPDFPQGEGKALLDKVVKAGECGALVNAKDVETAAGMAAFVEKIFLGPPPPPPPPPAAEAPVVVPPVVAPGAAPDQLEAIYFDFDKYVILPEGREALKRNAEWLQKNAGAKVVVEGNCDDRGTNEYNMALGQRRADAAAKYLMDLGIGKDRVSTVSYGEEKPLCKEANEECWSRNRRDDFIISKP